MTSLATLAATQYTFEYSDWALGDLPSDAVLAFAGQSTEERGRHPIWDQALASRARHCVEIDPDSGGPDSPYTLRVMRNGTKSDHSLRDDKSIVSAMAGSDELVLDISGLAHQAWAPIVRACLAVKSRALRVVYVEPSKYRSHSSPATLGSFDLSVRFEGVRPIPGFARLSRRGDGLRRVYVPLLGFEGSRPRLVHAELDPSSIVPVIGLPGFRMEFPAVAVACNHAYLSEVAAYPKIRFARGSCPFDLFRTLDTVAKDESAEHLQIAPLGTKPHALGAILFALHRRDITEIVYDNPVRRPNRTVGIGLVHVYEVSSFMASL